MGNTETKPIDISSIEYVINNFILDVDDITLQQICHMFIKFYFFKDFKLLLDDYVEGCKNILKSFGKNKIIIFPGDSPSKIYLYLKNIKPSLVNDDVSMLYFSLSGIKQAFRDTGSNDLPDILINYSITINELKTYFEDPIRGDIAKYIDSKLPAGQITNYCIVDYIDIGFSCLVINAVIELHNNEINRIARTEAKSKYDTKSAEYDTDFDIKFNPIKCNTYVYIGIQYSKNVDKVMGFLNKSYQKIRSEQIIINNDIFKNKHYLVEFDDKIINIGNGDSLIKDPGYGHTYIINDGIFYFTKKNVTIYDSNFSNKIIYNFPINFKRILYASLEITIYIDESNFVSIFEFNKSMKVLKTDIIIDPDTPCLFSNNYLFTVQIENINIFIFQENNFIKKVTFPNKNKKSVNKLHYYDEKLYVQVYDNAKLHITTLDLVNYEKHYPQIILKYVDTHFSENKLYYYIDDLKKLFVKDLRTGKECTYTMEDTYSISISPNNDFIITSNSNHFRIYNFKEYINCIFLNSDNINKFRDYGSCGTILGISEIFIK